MIKRRLTVEETLLKLALIYAVKADRIKNRDSYVHLVEELEYSVISILLSYNSLEGFANSLGRRYYENHPDENMQKKWWRNWKGNINPNPLSELDMISKLGNLIRELSNSNPKINAKRSLPRQLKRDIEKMTEIRGSLIHYKAESYETGKLKPLRDGKLATPEFDIYNSNTAKEFLATYKKVVDEFDKYSGMKYGIQVDRIFSDHGRYLFQN